jgi:hypothetical protein
VFPDITENAQNVLQTLLKMNYIFYLNAQNTMKTENQCCLKLQLYVVTLEILSQNKLIWLFNSANIELLKTFCKFILKHDLP